MCVCIVCIIDEGKTSERTEAKRTHLAFWPGRRPGWLIWPMQQHFHLAPLHATTAGASHATRPYTRPLSAHLSAPVCLPVCPVYLSACPYVLWLFPIWNYRNAFRDAATTQCRVASVVPPSPLSLSLCGCCLIPRFGSNSAPWGLWNQFV